jgi:hypothetical protein
MHIVAEQHLIQLVYVRLVGEHDVAGIVKRKTVTLDGAAPTTHAISLLEQ